MDVNLRPAVAADAQECGRICHDAFASIATRHGFTSDFPSVEVAVSIVSGLIAHPKFYSVVAELNGRIVGAISWMSAPRSWGWGRSQLIRRCRTVRSAAR